MKGEGVKLMDLFDNNKSLFYIPIYQRKYDWKKGNCKQLFDDLLKMSKSSIRKHFFGSIVSKNTTDSNIVLKLCIIDGQQRITTISLLILAMKNYLKNSNFTCKEFDEEDLINILYGKKQKEKVIRLNLTEEDQKVYEKMIEGSLDNADGSSNLLNNYDYFYKRIENGEISLDDLYQAIYGLEIISIALDDTDNPQRIFESLNSTGLALNEADKIKNFVLMGFGQIEQRQYYQKYWKEIENNTDNNVSDFIRYYLYIKYSKSSNAQKKDEIYFDFKMFVYEQNTDESNLNCTMERVLSDMLAYSKRYHVLLKGFELNEKSHSHEDIQKKKINLCVNRFQYLKNTTPYPFFLEVLRLYDENILNVSDVLESFSTIENWFLRRMVCELSNSGLNRFFRSLAKEITELDGSNDNYVDKIKYIILSKKDKSRFPDDEEFIECFKRLKVYTMAPKDRTYILERMENVDTLEDTDVYRRIKDKTYSIEHVMPQVLTEKWKSDLGNDWERIHETWLNRIANLTLTAYNSKYSNKQFSFKKSCQNGFNDSGIRMNQYISRFDKWGEDELIQRGDYLMSIALKIWPMIATNYWSCRYSDEEIEYALSDEFSPTYREISRIQFKDRKYPVNSWTDMFVKVIKILNVNDPNVLTSAMSQAGGMSFLADNPGKLHNPKKVDSNIYVECLTDSTTKLTHLRKIFDLYGEDYSELKLYIKNTDDDNGE